MLLTFFFSGSVEVVAVESDVKNYGVSKMCVLSSVAKAAEPSSQTQVPDRCPQGHMLLALVVLRQLHLQSENLIADT